MSLKRKRVSKSGQRKIALYVATRAKLIKAGLWRNAR